MNTCIRIYPNGEYRLTTWDDKETEEWVAYNLVYRFGNALFVNGKCRGKGYFSEAECESLEEAILLAGDTVSFYRMYIKNTILKFQEKRILNQTLLGKSE